MLYSGIVFDFNGVLLWDRPLHEQAWAQYARQLRAEPFQIDEMAQKMHGRNNRTILEYLAGRTLSDIETKRLSDEKEAIYQRLCLNDPHNFQLSPGSEALLDTLSKHKIPRTIATASEINNVDFFWTHLGLGEWFDRGQVVYDNGLLASKPAPDFYLQACQNLGLKPQDCVVVEDSISGLESAFAANIGYILALGPSGKHKTLESVPGVNRVIRNMGEIQTIGLFL